MVRYESDSDLFASQPSQHKRPRSLENSPDAEAQKKSKPERRPPPGPESEKRVLDYSGESELLWDINEPLISDTQLLRVQADLTMDGTGLNMSALEKKDMEVRREWVVVTKAASADWSSCRSGDRS